MYAIASSSAYKGPTLSTIRWRFNTVQSLKRERSDWLHHVAPKKGRGGCGGASCNHRQKGWYPDHVQRGTRLVFEQAQTHQHSVPSS